MNTATAYDPYLNTLATRNQPGGSARRIGDRELPDVVHDHVERGRAPQPVDEVEMKPPDCSVGSPRCYRHDPSARRREDIGARPGTLDVCFCRPQTGWLGRLRCCQLARGRWRRQSGCWHEGTWRATTSEASRRPAASRTSCGRRWASKHALALNSGTSALVCALVGAGIGPGRRGARAGLHVGVHRRRAAGGRGGAGARRHRRQRDDRSARHQAARSRRTRRRSCRCT